MNKEMTMRVALIVLCVALSAGAASAAEIVAPAELKAAWLDGKAVKTAGPRGGKSEITFRADGTLTRAGGRAGSASEGSWRMDEEGFCMTLGTAKRESCYVAIRGENGAIRVMRRSGAFVWTR